MPAAANPTARPPAGAPARPVSGGLFPALILPLTDGGRLDTAALTGWWMLVVYRGRHCPICKDYLGELQERLPDFQALGVTVVAASADPAHKARADVAEFGWTFPVAHDLTEDDMRRLGLYLSAPRSAQETDRLFPEPALFAVTPGGAMHLIDIANAPFIRPAWSTVLRGLNAAITRDYPVRGTA